MKKTFISVIFISLVLVLSSCKKENIGIFAPQKKINKIFLKYGTTDVLKEEWFWNNGLLTRIDYYKSNGLTLDYSEFFTYENNRIIEELRSSQGHATMSLALFYLNYTFKYKKVQFI